MSNLNTPRLVPVSKLTEADIDLLLAQRSEEMGLRSGVDEDAVAAARSLLHPAASADNVHGIPVAPFSEIRHERAAVPRRRLSMLSDLLNVTLILAGYAAAHWRRWVPAVFAIGLSAWWCFH